MALMSLFQLSKRVRCRGFTLMEVMVTVSIIGILAAIALPSYQKTVERGYWQEARDLLNTTYIGEQAYKSNNGKYHPDTGTLGTPGDWLPIFMDDPNLPSIPVDFEVSVFCAGPTCPDSFKAKATRRGVPGKFMEIDESRQITGPWTMP